MIPAAKLTAQDIKCLGISTQRATFINWRKSSGKPFHNFITWKDVRADDLVQSWNNGISMKGIRAGSKFLHMLTRQKRFIVGGILKLQNKMVNMRLLWTLQNVPELMAAIKAGKNDVMFGTIDTWLLYKLSGDAKLHFSNISNVAATGNFKIVFFYVKKMTIFKRELKLLALLHLCISLLVLLLPRFSQIRLILYVVALFYTLSPYFIRFRHILNIFIDFQNS